MRRFTVQALLEWGKCPTYSLFREVRREPSYLVHLPPSPSRTLGVSLVGFSIDCNIGSDLACFARHESLSYSPVLNIILLTRRAAHGGCSVLAITTCRLEATLSQSKHRKMRVVSVGGQSLIVCLAQFGDVFLRQTLPRYVAPPHIL